jgi:ketol-acid reductoisomerase
LPVFDHLYGHVISGDETRIVLEKNSDPNYREHLEAELKPCATEMWQAQRSGEVVEAENWKKE